MAGYTFAEIRERREAADWENLVYHYGLRYDPALDDRSRQCRPVVMNVRTKPYPEVAFWESGAPFEGEIPDDGWHIIPTCDCPDCSASKV